MAFTRKTWKDRIAEYPTRRRLTKSDGSTELVTVAREEGEISQEGDAFSASNMNDLEKRVGEEFDAINSSLEKLLEYDVDNKVILTESNIPYTATKNGILLVAVQPKAQANGYASVESSILGILRVASYNKATNEVGTVSCSSFFIQKGDILKNYISVNCYSTKITFYPFK